MSSRIGIGIGVDKKAPTSGVSYSSQASAIFAAMPTQPSAARKTIIATFVDALVASGDWNYIDAMWVMAHSHQDGAVINWKTPGTLSLTEIGAIGWVADQGYTGASGKYLKTGFIPSTHGVNYTLNNACYGFYSRTNSDGTLVDVGVSDGTSAITSDTKDGGSIYYTINHLVSASKAITRSDGMIHAERNSSTAIAVARNGVGLGGSSATSISLPTKEIYLLGRNNNGTPDVPSTRQLSMFYIGGYSINKLNMYNYFQAYMTSLGTNV